MFLLESISDHCAIVIKLDANVVQKAKQFKYCDMWVYADDFMSRVVDCWPGRIDGGSMFQVVTELKRLNASLKALNREIC